MLDGFWKAGEEDAGAGFCDEAGLELAAGACEDARGAEEAAGDLEAAEDAAGEEVATAVSAPETGSSDTTDESEDEISEPSSDATVEVPPADVSSPEIPEEAGAGEPGPQAESESNIVSASR